MFLGDVLRWQPPSLTPIVPAGTETEEVVGFAAAQQKHSAELMLWKRAHIVGDL
jgi:hypothetical protein